MKKKVLHQIKEHKKRSPKLLFTIAHAVGYSASWGSTLELFSGLSEMLAYFSHPFVREVQLLSDVASCSKVIII